MGRGLTLFEPSLWGEACAIGKARMAKDGNPVRASYGVVLRTIFITVRARVRGVEVLSFFDQSGAPYFGVEWSLVGLPAGVCPDGLSPGAPWAREPHAFGNG